MYPIVPFAAGLATGALVLRLLRSERAQSRLHQTGSRVRRATASGLERIEGASARARARLGDSPVEAAVSGVGGGAPTDTALHGKPDEEGGQYDPSEPPSEGRL